MDRLRCVEGHIRAHCKGGKEDVMLAKNNRIENTRFSPGVPAPTTMGRFSQAAYQGLSMEDRFFQQISV